MNSSAGRLWRPCATLLLLVLLAACGAQDTRTITNMLVAAEKREGVPVKLLASQNVQDGTLVFYQFKREKVCGSGAVLLQAGKDPVFLREDHTCSNVDEPITFNGSGALGPYSLTYGLVFDQRVARVTVAYDEIGLVDANRHGGAWWTLQPAAHPERIDVKAYDAQGRSLGGTGMIH